MRELWCIKYGDSPAQIFVGRDGYRRSAQANPNYDYHHVEGVYSNDDLHYSVTTGEVHHKQDFKNRGNLLGAYCIVKKKNSSRPTYVFVDLKEYDTGKSLWASKKATMIKKVAEVQCLRMAMQEIFGGTYDESEMPQEKEINPEVQATVDHHKTIEGTPISQSDKMEEELLNTYLTSIENCVDKLGLQEIYKSAKSAAKNDKIASNKISIATKECLAKIVKQEKEVPASHQTTEEWNKAYDGEVK
jgi:phage recombination protein Bet